MQDATVQSIPQTSQVPPAVAPSNYVAAAPAAPSAPAPVQAPVDTSYQQAPGQANTSYQSTPSQYAPQSQPAAPQVANPWETAFNKVVGVLSAPVQSPFQAAPSAPTTQPTPVNYQQAPAPQATPPSEALTWSPSQELSPNYSQTSLNPSLEEAQFDQEIADYYNLSQESRQVIDAYGVEAPAILNEYALNLEGMLDSAVDWGNRAADCIQGYAEFAVNEYQENLAYNEILTNPDTLSDYTLKFFGPEGPYPVYESEQQLETPGYPTQQIPVSTQGMVPGAPVNMPAPPTAEAPQQPGDFWGSFSNQMDANPADAWRLLNNAQPQTVANKLFVME